MTGLCHKTLLGTFLLEQSVVEQRLTQNEIVA